jgi:hypothetical protein
MLRGLWIERWGTDELCVGCGRKDFLWARKESVPNRCTCEDVPLKISFIYLAKATPQLSPAGQSDNHL